MRPMPRAALLIALIVVPMSAAAGCGNVAETVERTGQAAEADGGPPMVSVEPPDASLAGGAAVAEAARSVVKIRGVAELCQTVLEGSGVVIAPNRVMSVAHSVAGAESVTVSVGGRDHDASVVSFDPKMDIAILDVPEMRAPPLEFAEDTAPTGTDALVLGYPGGGPFVANPARIREVVELKGPDIYRTTTVNREVYVVRGSVRQGGSGGPLIDLNGRVLGISFGAAVDDAETGFALTAKQVFSQRVVGAAARERVASGRCVS